MAMNRKKKDLTEQIMDILKLKTMMKLVIYTSVSLIGSKLIFDSFQNQISEKLMLTTFRI